MTAEFDLHLHGDFGLISTVERVRWRQALPRHILAGMSDMASGAPLPEWKVDEQTQPTLTTIHELLHNDPQATLQTLEEYFLPASSAPRSDYAS